MTQYLSALLFASLAYLFGPSGPGLKNSGGVIQARTNGDGAFAKVQAGTPTVGDDLTTKTYVDGLIGGTIEIPIGNTAGNFDSTATIPDTAIITRVSTKVTTPYNGSATISVGYAGSVSAFQATGENVPGSSSEYQNTRTTPQISGSAQAVRVTLGGTPSAGAGVCYVSWTMPQA